MKKFSDFAQEPQPLEGDKLRLDDVINQEIIITAFDIRTSRYSKNKSGKYLTLQFKHSGSEELFILFTGSDILIEQILKYEEEIPFMTTIKKINKYYTLS
jgi:hypothetical protein